MSRKLRWRAGVAALTALPAVLILAALLWRGAVWHERGWVGLTYGDPSAADLGKMAPVPGEVYLIQPDSPAERAGVRAGDRIVSILGLPLTEGEELRRRASALRRGDRATFVFERAGEERALDLPLESPFRSVPLVVRMATSLFVALAFLLTGSLVAWARPFARQARIFFLTTGTWSLLFGAASLSDLDFYSRRGFESFAYEKGFGLFLLVYLTLSSVASALLVHLSLVFPRERPILRHGRPVLFWVHGGIWLPLMGVGGFLLGSLSNRHLGWAAPWLALLVAVGFLVPLLREARRHGAVAALVSHPVLSWLVLLAVVTASFWPVHLVPKESRSWFGALLGLGTILTWMVIGLAYGGLTCWNLWQNYRGSDLEARRQLRWPLWGTLLGLGGSSAIGLVVVVQSLLSPTGPDVRTELFVGELCKLLYLLVPVGFAFGILKYRLLEVDLILRKTLVYSAATGVVVAGYFVLVGVLGVLLVSTLGVRNQAVTVLATLVVAALFVPVRRRIQRWVDHRFESRRAGAGEVLRRLGEHALTADLPDDLLKRAVEELQPALQVRSAVALGREQQPGEPFTVRAAVGVSEDALRDLHLEEGCRLVAPGEAVLELETGREETPPDATRGWSDAERRLLEATDAHHAVRVRHGERVEAALLLGAPREDDGEPVDLSLLAAVADQMAVGLGSLQRRQQDAEVQQAFQIQRALLPARLQQLPGFRVAARWLPARQVSGDYYDVLPLDPSHRGLCIGDVAGKGLPAALLMSSLQAAVKAMAGTTRPPGELVAAVRRVVSQNLTGGKFVTFFYAVLDINGRLAYASAGHNPPFLVRRDGAIERLDRAGGAIARLFLDSEIPEVSVQLDPGDRLVCFTDGVTEARDRRGEELGEERLEALLIRHHREPAEELAESITREVRAFTGGELQDDLSLLVVAVDEPEAG